jgi:predicted Rossmann fold nucleotide-binding protein DprA/Smf involved in DNA uptake
MTNRDILILLNSQLSKGITHKPFINSEIAKIISKLNQHQLELKDLNDMDYDTSIRIFFDGKIPGEKGLEFIERYKKLIERQGSMAFDLMEIKKWGIHILTIFDTEYPEIFKLKLGSKAPVLLYYLGDLKLIHNQFIGFSGSRLKKTDKYDETLTIQWANLVIENKFGIVSGGASGIDTFATKEAIQKQAPFIEFLSDSMIKRIQIPHISKAIRNGRGLLLSEVKPDAPFNAGNAMARNKYIYLLSKKVIVIRADYTIKNKIKTGGTWNGAIENLKSNYKNVYVVNESKAKGNKELIEQGAIPILTPSDPHSIEVILNESLPIKNDSQINQGIEEKMVSILKNPNTLNNITLTEKELEQISLIKDAISAVKDNFNELILPNKRLYEKFYRYCFEVAVGQRGEQLTIF